MAAPSGSLTPILLLPGLFAGDWIWKPTRDRLVADSFQVFTIAEPFAALDTESSTIDSLRTLVIDLLDRHEIRRAVLCGNSLGALVALDTAVHHPDRVEAVVISGCPGLGGTLNFGLQSPPDACEIADKTFFDPSRISTALIEESYRQIAGRRCAINIVRYLIAIREYNVAACLVRIPCRVLMIWGANDQIAPVEPWHDHAAPGALRVIPQCGHSPMIEKPVEFHAALREFLARPASK